MNVIAQSTLRAFWSIPQFSDSEQALRAWYLEATKANWTQPADIKATFASVSILKGNRVVFNIKGNNYRLIAAVAYKRGHIYVKFVGTHAQYDAIDAQTVDQSIG